MFYLQIVYSVCATSKLTKDRVAEDDREHFLKIAKEEIAALHEGNFARYRLRPGEFLAWQKRKT